MVRKSLLVAVLIGVAIGSLPTAAVADHGNAEAVFGATWERTDLPVSSGQVERTWIWGPQPRTAILHEPYAESVGGQRSVQYYDKSRMEVTYSNDDQNSSWYVTNGLLVMELMTGRLQLGDSTFDQRDPAEVTVAGDVDDPFGPTYRTMAMVRSEPAASVGSTINQRISRTGVISIDESLTNQGIEATVVIEETGHSIAAPFWDFMNSSGTIYLDGAFVDGQLFEVSYFATGLPVTEPYWANVLVDGETMLVLLQCFERRCLTYTPGNEPGWQVEAGNVGLHYWIWRYSTDPGLPPGVDCEPGDGPDYAGQDLVQPVFISQDLACADFNGARLNQGNFSEADLRNADFSGAEVIQPIFRNTSLDGALFLQTELNQPTFEGATATNADFSNALLMQPIFNGANLQGAEMRSASFVMPQFVNTICPDGTNSDANSGTCLGNLEPET